VWGRKSKGVGGVVGTMIGLLGSGGGTKVSERGGARGCEEGGGACKRFVLEGGRAGH